LPSQIELAIEIFAASSSTELKKHAIGRRNVSVPGILVRSGKAPQEAYSTSLNGKMNDDRGEM
jgi:hypothetical protein